MAVIEITADQVTGALAEITRNIEPYHGEITAAPDVERVMRISFPTVTDACGWATEFELAAKVEFAAPVLTPAEPVVLLVGIADYIALDD